MLDLIPWWVKLAILAAIAGAVYFGWEHYVANPYREEGAAPVRAALAQYKSDQDKQRSEIILDYVHKEAVADEEHRRALDDQQKRIAILESIPIQNTVHGVTLGTDLDRLLDAISAPANGPQPAAADGGKQPPAETVARSTEASVYDESVIGAYIKEGHAAYDDGVELMRSCRVERDLCRNIRSKTLGGTP